MKDNNRPAMLANLLGSAMFGFSFIFTKTALGIATPLTMLAIRFTLAFLIMSILAVTRLTPVRLKGKKLGGLLCMGLMEPVLYFFFESFGLKYVATSVAGVLIALIPVVVMALGTVFLKEKPSLIQSVCMLVSVGGVAAISLMGRSEGRTSAIGIVLLLGAVFSASAFTLISRKLSGTFTPFERTYVTTGLAMAVFVSCAVISGGRGFWGEVTTAFTDVSFVLSILYLAGVCSIGAFVLINYAIGKLSVSRSSSFANLTTVVTVAAGVLILHEAFTWWQAAASLLVVFGVYGVNRAERTPLPEPANGGTEM